MGAVSIGQPVNVRGEHGTVRFVGPTQFALGEWVGVELDHPKGRNNGSVQGVEYFKCQKSGNYGVFVRSEILNEEPAVKNGPSVGPDVKSVVSKLQSKLRQAVEEIRESKETVANLEVQIKNEKRARDEIEATLDQSTVDLEYLRGSNTELTQSLESLRDKYDHLSADFSIVSEELEIHKELEKAVTSQSPSEPISVEDYHTLVIHSKKLELALSSLKSLLEEAEYSKAQTLKILNEKSIEYARLQTSHETLHEKLTASESAVRQLQEHLEATSESSSVIEYLTVENEKLQSEISELTQTVNELTELHEMDKTIEEDHILAQKELQGVISELKNEIGNHKKQLGQLQTKNNALAKESSEFKRGLQNGHTPRTEHDYEELILEYKKLKVKDSKLFLNNSILQATADSVSGLPKQLVPDKFKDQVETIVVISACIASCSELLTLIRSLTPSGGNFEAQLTFESVLSSLYFLRHVAEHIHSMPKGKSHSFLDQVSLMATDLSKAISLFEPSDLYTLDLSRATSVVKYSHEMSSTIQSSNIAKAKLWYTCVHRDLCIAIEIVRQVCDSYSSNVPKFEVMNIEMHQFINNCERVAKKATEKLNILEDNRALDLVDAFTDTRNDVLISPNLIVFLKDLEMQIGIDEEDFHKKVADSFICSREIQNALAQYESELTRNLIFEEYSSLSIYQMLCNENESGAQHTMKELSALENQLLEKTQNIQNLTLQIELLEKNMSSAVSGKDVELDEVKKQVNELRKESKSLKQQSEDLQLANKKLQAQIDDMQSADHPLFLEQTPAFESLKAMREYTNAMALAEEISLLKRMARMKTNGVIFSSTDESWLYKPLVPRKKEPNYDTGIAFLKEAHRRRKVASALAHAIIRSSAE